MAVNFGVMQESADHESRADIVARWADFCREGPSRRFHVFVDNTLFLFERPAEGGDVRVEECIDRTVGGEDGYDISGIRDEANDACAGMFTHDELERRFDGFELFVPNWTPPGERIRIIPRARFGFERVANLEVLTFDESTDVTRRLERAAAFCEEYDLLLQFSY